MECFECGGLGHFRRDCPQRRTRTRTARAPSSGTRDRRLLAMTELQAGQSPCNDHCCTACRSVIAGR
ncbi:Uncharacterized protein TSPI_00061 [Trichinella spiralis]|uniref:CCHC-type domain-containing protein n=1 Tax=Trichinella spiralis TaxID=6334 RepID=A0ABR3KRK3_TRISP